jgi:hydrogenase maturation protease
VRRLLIGLGNELRGDDAAGLLVAREARRQLAEGGIADPVEVRELAGEPVGLLEAWAEAERVVLADAVASGAPPGTVHCLDAAAGPLPAAFAGASTHALGLAEAVELGRSLGRLPQALLVLGIEGSDFATGAEPGEPVRAAITAVAAQGLAALAIEVRGRRAGQPSIAA